MTSTLLQPVISPTGIRYILDNYGRQIATVSSLLDGIDNAARAKESEFIHNAICDRFNNAAALTARVKELEEAKDKLEKAAFQAVAHVAAANYPEREREAYNMLYAALRGEA